MFRIIICISDINFSKSIFDSMRVYLSTARIGCELSIVRDLDSLTSKIQERPYFYDIFVLDESLQEHLHFAAALRKKNFYASLIFLIGTEKKHNFLRYRPTAVINDLTNEQQIVNALRLTLEEQRYVRPYFTIKNRDAIVRVFFSDILYFESKKRIITLHSKNRAIDFYGKLGDVLSYLPADGFIRCHQSYIVNTAYVEKLDKVNRFITINHHIIEVSKSYYPHVVEHLSQHR